jgi:hypothetical protein
MFALDDFDGWLSNFVTFDGTLNFIYFQRW